MRDGIKTAARLGYAARGIVYVIVGFFAALAAFGNSQAEGTQGALEALLGQPFGSVLVAILIIGLIAFAAWRLIQSFRDTDKHGSDAKGLAIRAGLVGAALSYGALAFFALGLLLGWGSGEGGGDPTSQWLRTLYDAGLGGIVVYGVALILAAVGVAHIIKGWRAGFEKYFRCSEDVMRWLRPVGRLGLIARGIVFLVLALLVFRGGLAYEAENRPGMQDALNAIQNYSFGWLLLLAIGLGLLAFGLYSLAESRYREVRAA